MAFPKVDLGKLRESVASGVKTAQDGLGSGIKTAQEGLSGIKIDEVVQGAKDAVASGASAIGDAVGSIVAQNREDQEATPSDYREFVSLLWYLANIDGAVSDKERETLDQLAGSIDDSYSSYAESLEEECSSALAASANEFGAHAAAKIEAQKVIETLSLSPMDAKLMCWNLLALANSDGLDEKELDFVRFVSEKAGVSRSVFEELRNYSDAVVEIGKAREQLKESNRSYGEIEPLVAEYAERERVVLESAQALVSDR